MKTAIRPTLKTLVLSMATASALLFALPSNAAERTGKNPWHGSSQQQHAPQRAPVQSPRPQVHNSQHAQPTRQVSRNNVRTTQRYQFRDSDRAQLQRQYRRVLPSVRHHARPTFVTGQRIPTSYRRAITPAPYSVVRRLTPPPRGYQVGYYQGYSVVYDPRTFLILSIIDLLN